MRITALAATAAATIALVPTAFAVAGPGAGNPGHHTGTTGATGSTGSTGSTGATGPKATKAKAYGTLCKALSKKHVKGQKGTPFSQCVVALAQLDKGEVRSAKKACKSLSKKHVKGAKGTPYSQCVKAAARLRHAS